MEDERRKRYTKQEFELMQLYEKKAKENGLKGKVFSIGRFAEGRLCVERFGEHWVVYKGEGGKVTSPKSCDSIYDALSYTTATLSDSMMAITNIKRALNTYKMEHSSLEENEK